MQRNFSFSVGEIYHLYNRGVNKQPIFLNEHDRVRFLILLYLCNGSNDVHISNNNQGRALIEREYFDLDKGEPLVEIIAYCLMPNHFHLLVKEKEEGGISKFMLKLLTGYGMYFNKRNQRTGPIFEGRFKAKHVFEDSYLEYLLAYIHLNPVKIKDEEGWNGKSIPDLARAKEFLEDYRFSSYLFFLGQDRPENSIFNIEALSEEVLGEQKNLKELVKLWSDFEV